MATVEELVVRIKADASQLDRELARINTTTKRATSSMTDSFNRTALAAAKIVPAAAVAALVGLAKSGIDAAGRFTDLSQQIDFAASSLAALEIPLRNSGGSLDAFAASLNILNSNVGQAISGNQSLNDVFSRLGLSAKQLQDLGPEKAFYAVADALARVGTQSEQTELGRALLGRGFASMIPLIKEANGSLEDFVNTKKDITLNEEQIKTLDDTGDAIEILGIKARDAVAGGLADFLKWTKEVGPGSTTQMTLDALDRAKARVDADRNSAADSSRRAGFSFDGPTYTPYDKNASQYTPIPKQSAPARSGQSSTSTVASSYKQISAAASEATPKVKAMDDAVKEFQRSQLEAAQATERLSEQIQDRLGDAFETAIFDAENAGSAITGILDGIARQIARTAFINPLSEGLGGLIKGALSDGGSSIFSNFGGFFADGGSPPVGRPSVVGERGPELFVPKVAGTIIPNGVGGSSTVINQTLSFNNSVQGAARAEIMAALPYITSVTNDAVFSSMRRGGSASKIAGVR